MEAGKSNTTNASSGDNRVKLTGMACRLIKNQELSYPTRCANFPYVIEPLDASDKDRLPDLVRENQHGIKQLLTETGALLFRGFAIGPSDSFEDLMVSQGLNPSSGYDFGMTKRSAIAGRVFTSTDLDRRLMIPPHTEMSYSNIRPSWLAFYCHTKPALYGETPIFDMQGVYRDLPESLRDIFTSHRLVYERKIPAKHGALKLERTIEQTFGTEDHDEIQSKANELGFDVEWLTPNLLQTTTHIPPVIKHPATGEPCWNAFFAGHESYAYLFQKFADREKPLARFMTGFFFAASKHLKFGQYQTTRVENYDLSKDEISKLFDALFANATIFDWQVGDLLFLDNVRTGHGRMTFKGSRQIQTCFGDHFDIRNQGAEEYPLN